MCFLAITDIEFDTIMEVLMYCQFLSVMEVLVYQEEVPSGHSHWGKIGLEDLKDPLLLKFWI